VCSDLHLCATGFDGDFFVVGADPGLQPLDDSVQLAVATVFKVGQNSGFEEDLKV